MTPAPRLIFDCGTDNVEVVDITPEEHAADRAGAPTGHPSERAARRADAIRGARTLAELKAALLEEDS